MSQGKFESTLREDDLVRVRWRQGSGRGVIEKVNRTSFRVRLMDSIGKYPAGSRIRVMRVSSGRWSATNNVRSREE